MGLTNWETITDESQDMVKKVSLIGGGSILIILTFSKIFLSLALLGSGSYVAWRAFYKKLPGMEENTRKFRRRLFIFAISINVVAWSGYFYLTKVLRFDYELMRQVRLDG